jgi:hypothetical protein
MTGIAILLNGFPAAICSDIAEDTSATFQTGKDKVMSRRVLLERKDGMIRPGHSKYSKDIHKT